jgi:hypothetical protein
MYNECTWALQLAAIAAVPAAAARRGGAVADVALSRPSYPAPGRMRLRTADIICIYRIYYFIIWDYFGYLEEKVPKCYLLGTDF